MKDENNEEEGKLVQILKQSRRASKNVSTGNLEETRNISLDNEDKDQAPDVKFGGRLSFFIEG